jgi:hypothetical protein
MKTTSTARPPPTRIQRAGRLLAALALLALALAAPPARAEEAKLSKDTEACLKCHDKPAIEKKLGDGRTLFLSISAQDYLASTHKDQDCTDCHSDLDDKTHGKVPTPMKSRRELTQSMQDSCRDCHKKKYTQYDDSIHAVLAKGGDEKAPLCADCHNPHTQRPVKIATPIEQTPCAACHGAIFKAYALDVHGLERTAKGKVAPLCADCHQAHDVKAASLGEGRKGACLSCHKDAIARHKDWLPNAALHFEAISCPACHAPNAQRRVNLRLYDATSKAQLREKTGVPRFTQRAQAGDAASLGLDERALWLLLAQFGQDSALPGNVVLRGRLEVSSGVEAHQISDKSKAVSDCDSCHGEGAEPFQSVVISIAGPDGRPLRHGVQKDVLNSLTAMQSVRGFYAIGSTRIKLLDWLIVALAGGSIAFVLGHMTIRRLFKGQRERRAAAEAAAKRSKGDGGSA